VERFALLRPRFDCERPAEAVFRPADLEPVDREALDLEALDLDDVRFEAALVREPDPVLRELLPRDRDCEDREFDREDDCFLAVVLRPRVEAVRPELDFVFDRPLAAVFRPVLRPDELAEPERPRPDVEREEEELDEVERADPERDDDRDNAERPLAFVRPPRDPPRPEFFCSAVSREISLLKLLCWPRAVCSWCRSARPRSSNFSKKSSHEIASSELPPL